MEDKEKEMFFTSLGFSGSEYENLINVIVEIVNESDKDKTISKDIKSLPFDFVSTFNEITIVVIEYAMGKLLPETNRNRKFFISNFHIDTDYEKKRSCGKITVEVKE